MKKFLLTVLILSCFYWANGQVATRVVCASPYQDSLWVLDTVNFKVALALAPVPNTGTDITGIQGLSKSPMSGNIYMAFKQSGVTGRVLGKLDLSTDTVTIIGNLGDNFSSITFTADGKLFGATGDGAIVPESLYQIDTATAATRLVKTMGNGADGEIICYNPEDNMIYHWSGNTAVVFEKMDTIAGPYNFTDITLNGAVKGEIFGACYAGAGSFLVSNLNFRFQHFLTNGTATSEYGDSTSDNVRGFAIIDCPRSITGDTAFCQGDSTMLTFSSSEGASTYQWFLNGTMIPGATSQTYYASQKGHYNCMVSDICGTDSSGPGIDIIQNSLPAVSISGNSNICTGDTSLLSATGGGTSQWYRNGVAIPGATGNSYKATAAGVYNMVKTNLKGCSDSASAGIVLKINPYPVVSISGDTSICSGDTATLSVTSAGSSQWYMNGIIMPGATSDTLKTADPGAYNVVQTTNGCSDSAATGINLQVNPIPMVAVSGDTSKCEGDTAVFSGMGGGAGQWYRNGTAIAGATSDTYKTTVAGSYNMVRTYMGCSDSADIGIMLQIHLLPAVQLTADANSACTGGGMVTLTGTPAGGTYSGTGVNGNKFDPSVAGAGNFTLSYSYTDAQGCSSENTVSVTVTACTGFGDNRINDLMIFPNPAENFIRINLPDKSTFTLVNILGEVQVNSVMEEGTHIIDLSDLAEGIYIVKILNDLGQTTWQLIIRR